MGRQKTLRVLRVRQARRSREMTQAELARRVGVSTPTICEIEKGKLQPSLSTARKIAQELHGSIEELFSYVEVPV